MSWTLLASLVLAIGWPAQAFASAAPRTVAATLDAAVAQRASRAPIRFDLVGATWTGAVSPGAEVRTSFDGERWSGWQALAPDDIAGDRGEGNRGRHATVLWTGDARFVQTRGFARGHLDLINTKGDADDPSLPLRALRSFARWLHASRSAEAGVGPIGIYTRAQWGADESLRTEAPDYASENKMTFIHHTDGANGYATGDVPSIIRGIYYYHVKVRGFRDIAYNFLVDRFGRTWEGRWGGMDKTVIGAHTAGLNTSSIGVAMVGTYSSVTPSTATQDAIVRLLSWKFTIHKIVPRSSTTMKVGSDGARWPVGTTVTFNTIAGHRDGVSTDCPGTAGYNTLGSIRARVQARILPPGTFTFIGSSVWEIVDGGRKHVPTMQVLTTTVTSNEIHRLTAEEAYSIPSLGRVMYRDGLLVEGDRSPTVYLVSSGMLRPFRSAADFTGMGFRWESILKTATAFLDTLAKGDPVDPKEYPDGVLLRADSGGTVFRMQGGKLASIYGPVFRSWHFTSKDVVVVPAKVVDTLPHEGHLLFREGALLSGSDTRVWVISDGHRRPIANRTVFDGLGYQWNDILEVSDTLLAMHPTGWTLGWNG